MSENSQGIHIDRETIESRRVQVIDMEGKVHMDFTLVGAIIISVLIPIIPVIVFLQVLAGKRTVSVIGI